MKNDTRKMKYVGLDVHAETISIAVADGESRQAARSVATIPNDITKLSKALGKLGKPEQLLVCYEAGPTGFELHRKLSQKGIYCEVIAPTLVPVRSGDRVKTDARDARKLAQSYRAGELTPIYVPSGQQEALRDLVRTREIAKKDETRGLTGRYISVPGRCQATTWAAAREAKRVQARVTLPRIQWPGRPRRGQPRSSCHRIPSVRVRPCG